MLESDGAKSPLSQVMEFRDYYQTLGLQRSATADDVRKAYRRLARKYHPDVSKEAYALEHGLFVSFVSICTSIDPEMCEPTLYLRGMISG